MRTLHSTMQTLLITNIKLLTSLFPLFAENFFSPTAQPQTLPKHQKGLITKMSVLDKTHFLLNHIITQVKKGALSAIQLFVIHRLCD